MKYTENFENVNTDLLSKDFVLIYDVQLLQLRVLRNQYCFVYVSVTYPIICPISEGTVHIGLTKKYLAAHVGT